MIKEDISPIITELANLTLQRTVNGESFQNFDDKILADSVLIFQYVFTSKLWEYGQKNNIPQKELELMAENAGKYLRNHLITFVGVDLHKVFKDEK